MARKTKVFKIDDKKSRDNGKSFLLTELDADTAEWWAIRALQGILGTDAEIELDAPLAQLARMGLAAMAKVPPEKLKPLLDEMMGCVRIKLPSGGESRDLLPGDIEEVKTRVILRKEVLALHVDFSDIGGE